MASKYWDIDDILAEDDNVTVIAMHKGYKLSFLDPNANKTEKDLEEGTKTEIPLWLAHRLSVHKFLAVESPLPYREKFKKALLADPTVINLRDKSAYYYERAIRLADILEDSGSISEVLPEIFLKRIKGLLKTAQHMPLEESTSFTKKLTNIERHIFESGRDAIINYKMWKDDTSNLINMTNSTRLRKKVKLH